MLWDSTNETLIPIDHGLSLLDSLDWKQSPMSETSGEWLAWPQIQESMDPSVVDWIRNLDIDQTSEELADVGMSETSLREFKMRAIFLKTAIDRGVGLYDIGKMCMQNETEGTLCRLDNIIFLALSDFIDKYGENVENKDEEFYNIFYQRITEQLNK
jgi:hypothetical protein